MLWKKENNTENRIDMIRKKHNIIHPLIEIM